MSSEKAARWLVLVAFLLQHHFAVTREANFEHVRGYESDDESARRKFERDKDELRALGVEIESVRLPNGESGEDQSGYRLRPAGFYLPYFQLTEKPARDEPYRGLRRVPLSRDEALALDRATRRLAARTEFPLASAAASARRKLAFDLPLAPDAVERVLAMPLSDASRQALAALQEAAANRTAVSCRYYSIGRDAEETREIEPWGLFFQQSRWYCVGRARDRDAVRVFRVDRLRDATPLQGPDAGFEVPELFDIQHYLGRAPWEFGAERETLVRVRFAFPASTWVMNQRLGRFVPYSAVDGEVMLDFDVRNLDAFLRWLLTFRRQATVIWPPDVAESLDELRGKVAAIYREDTG